MFKRDYQFPGCEHYLDASANLKQLLANDDVATRDGIHRALLVWRGGFASNALSAAFETADWPIRLLEAMPPSEAWPWKWVGADTSETDPTRIMQAVQRASGVEHTPQGNVHLTLELRRYEEKHSTVGDLAWWKSRQQLLEQSGEFGRAFITTLLRAFESAQAAGSELFTEQLSIVISKDPQSVLFTLTPTLHADEYYARRQTAIVSLLETGWDSIGGAVFLPKRSMQSLWHLRPITLQRLQDEFDDEVLLRTESGDVMIYDGMINEEGVVVRDKGIPHISPDAVGKTSRLCVLMYHKR
ncbi:hypothetical protein FFI16_002810 [Pseudomonas sp. KBS0710]|uniref:hypothetical protein n=1 Tax=Pseudomonas sp. KBS0710 TaxID=1179667 RepID=UPI00110F2486|nr:hypothetical protein [Pseudomonas sp. KBS0710]TSD75389.1 hypothetical protein FFI16_002810 [Pseudomonas sp. KBS0710]